MTARQSAGLLPFLVLITLTACATAPSGEPSRPAGTPASQPAASQAAVLPTQVPDQTAADPGSGESASNSGDQGCGEARGAVQPYQITWQGEVLTGRIYIPACFGQDPDRSYPALYLLHGATETDQQWEDLGVGAVADALIARGSIPPLLIVMPREDTWLPLRENPFGDQLVQAVIPWVETTYQAVPDRQHRAVGGLSRGGNWAVRLGLLHWGLFGSLGGHSAPLFIGDLAKVPGWLEAIPLEKVPRIYLDIGEDDRDLSQAEAFRAALQAAGIDPDWHLNPGLHDEAYWRSHLEDYLLWYSAGWSDH